MKGHGGEVLSQELEVRSQEKRPVFAFASVNESWLTVECRSRGKASAQVIVRAHVPSQFRGTLEGLACLAVATDQPTQAVHLLAAAATLRERTGGPVMVADREYYDHIGDICDRCNAPLKDAYRSEREDWIQSMVMSGMGICFLPEFSPVLPGLQTRRVIEPEVVRAVSLVTVSGRRFSPAVATFVRALKAYKWPT